MDKRDSPTAKALMDTSRFDRRVELTDDEKKAISNITINIRDWRMLDKMKPHLQRFYDPLEEARRRIFDNSSQPCAQGYPLLHFILMIGEKERSFWGWTRDDWQDLFRKDGRNGFQIPLAIAYLLCGIESLPVLSKNFFEPLCHKVFGREAVLASRERVRKELMAWNYTKGSMKGPLTSLHRLLLMNGSPHLEDLTFDILLQAYDIISKNKRRSVVVLSKILNALELIGACIVPPSSQGHRSLESMMQRRSLQEVASEHGVSAEWLDWCWRWYNTSTLLKRTRIFNYNRLRLVGRWLMARHPEVTSPAQWDRKLAASFVAMVDRLCTGDYSGPNYYRKPKPSAPLSASSKGTVLSMVRVFFKDCQEWGWIEPRFNPDIALRVPRSIRRSYNPNPRVIADEVWGKLLWAGLNLTAEDIPERVTGEDFYPVQLVRAVALVWLFGGLRNNEICRLRLGCVRWEAVSPESEAGATKARVCLLSVPLNKTGPSFVKPVDAVVGEAIEAWETIRPVQPLLLDRRTGEMVHLLFSVRGVRLGGMYINKRLIPLLCRKAGVPQNDARGNITSHRARSTIATQLYSAKQGMSLFELQEWLGHRSPSSTRHYIKLTPTKLAKAFVEADYFRRNVRMVDVLIDADAVRSGLPATGEAWRYYDLGHGYCTFDFFEQCPHRMTCAKCDYYVPKASTRAQLLEGKANLLRMRQEIPLTDEEMAAVDDGIAMLEKLCERLSDIPTPAGPTPRELIELRKNNV